MTRPTDQKSNYQSAAKRIDNATTPEDVKLVELGLDRVYDAGHLTTSEFSRLSDRALRRTIELEDDRSAALNE